MIKPGDKITWNTVNGTQEGVAEAIVRVWYRVRTQEGKHVIVDRTFTDKKKQ